MKLSAVPFIFIAIRCGDLFRGEVKDLPSTTHRWHDPPFGGADKGQHFLRYHFISADDRQPAHAYELTQRRSASEERLV
jgi:hypothetical protein